MQDDLARVLQIIRVEQAEESLMFRGTRYDAKDGIWKDKTRRYRSYKIDSKGNIHIIDD